MKVNVITSEWMFKDHGFPLATWRVTDHPLFPLLHRHEFYELVLITHGRGRHRSENDEYPITAGDVFLLHGNMLHGYADVHQLNLVNIGFQPRELGLPLANLADLPGYQLLFHIEPRLRQQNRFRDRLHLTPEQLLEAERLVALLEHELAARAPGYRFAAQACLMQLIAYLARCNTTACHPTNGNGTRLGAVLTYLEKHYREPISMTQLIAVAGMSESTLARSFQRVFHHAPIEYLIRLRIQKACELLADPGARITEIALACGFNDSNYFARQFRRVLECSPSEYRQALSEPTRVSTCHLPRPLKRPPVAELVATA
ncbi:MAG: HTH-type transcriptional activator RhaR [Verrucomicrobiae bacterium]|nr:HTH-type transcriptional activator RhaR [Verrucomicrobiae bacterium]